MAQAGESRIELYLLGGIELRGVDRATGDRLLAQAKLSALLAFLSLAPAGLPQRRDRIVGLLWPELDQAHARTALRKALHAVRATLGADVVRTRGDEEVALAFPPMWCDAVELASAADSGKMLRATELYRGELMPGFHLADCVEFERWLEDERTLARERAGAAAWGLAASLERDSRLTDAGRMARRAVRYSWDDERVLRRTISMLARIGDHAGALRLYDEFAERMRSELDAEPSPETTALVDALRPSAR
ncbi:MAG TPA: BTAD domain-containing putative transcriptional regulator [Gemmatimonadaceae bacterium]|nr:BTAD domain-containing putative transcriptional regulator [Gemmatimonadaceae bacterium]